MSSRGHPLCVSVLISSSKGTCHTGGPTQMVSRRPCVVLVLLSAQERVRARPGATPRPPSLPFLALRRPQRPPSDLLRGQPVGAPAGAWRAPREGRPSPLHSCLPGPGSGGGCARLPGPRLLPGGPSLSDDLRFSPGVMTLPAVTLEKNTFPVCSSHPAWGCAGAPS